MISRAPAISGTTPAPGYTASSTVGKLTEQGPLTAYASINGVLTFGPTIARAAAPVAAAALRTKTGNYQLVMAAVAVAALAAGLAMGRAHQLHGRRAPRG